MLENTSKRDPALHLLGAMGEGPDNYITGMEAAGQRQLVNSDRLPTQVIGGDDEQFLALGFTFGEPDKHDELFRPATLPPGWKREASDHSMWSYIVDEHGRRRVSVFYKAAFYDRTAEMRLDTHYAYLSSVLDDGGEPILDDAWLPAAAAVAELDRIAARYDEEAVSAADYGQRDPSNDFWPKRAAEDRARRDAARAMRDRITARAQMAEAALTPDALPDGAA
jgi:hypothetical protein